MAVDTLHTIVGFEDAHEHLCARDLLLNAGYSEEGICSYLGNPKLSSPLAVELPSMALPASGGSQLETLMRLFLLSIACDAKEVEKVIPKCDAWINAGILKRDQDCIQPLLRIVPFREFFVASDVPQSTDMIEHVMGVGGSSLTLATSMIQRQAALTLDVGSGCGIQSLLAARHSQQVIGVDRNSRAIQLGEFNRLLNGVEHVQFVEGSLFEPVDGQKFDLIVSNPPFVISPTFRAHYRDGEGKGDQFCESLIRSAPEYLQPGGFCQVVCNWAQVEGQAWQDRLASWCEGSGCIVWVIRGKAMTPTEYTMFWNEDEKKQPGFEQTYRQWLDYFEHERIESIGVGLITMRKSLDGSAGFRADNAPNISVGDVGADIERAFESYDLLRSTDDSQLLSMRLSVAPNVGLQQDYTSSPNGWKSLETRLTRKRGLGYVEEVDQSIAQLLHQFDGSATLLQNIQRCQQNLADVEQVTRCCKAIRHLIALGFVELDRTSTGD